MPSQKFFIWFHCNETLKLLSEWAQYVTTETGSHHYNFEHMMIPISQAKTLQKEAYRCDLYQLWNYCNQIQMPFCIEVQWKAHCSKHAHLSQSGCHSHCVRNQDCLVPWAVNFAESLYCKFGKHILWSWPFHLKNLQFISLILFLLGILWKYRNIQRYIEQYNKQLDTNSQNC